MPDCPHNADPATCMACLDAQQADAAPPPRYAAGPCEVFFDVPQYTPEWWACRRGVISASNFHRFAPVWPPRTTKVGKPHAGDMRDRRAAMLDYACRLVGDLYDERYGQHEDYQSAAMKNGTIMEPHVRRWYEFEADCTVRQVGFLRTPDGLVGCSPDGLVGDDGGLELKSPAHATHVGYLIEGVLPPEYRAQVHAGLIVTSRKWWDFVSYVDGLPPLRVRVVPDAYTERLRESLYTMVGVLAMVREKIASMVPKATPTNAEEVAKIIDEQAAGLF